MKTARSVAVVSVIFSLCACGVTAVGSLTDGATITGDASSDVGLVDPNGDATSSIDASVDASDASIDAALDATDAAVDTGIDAADAGVTFCKTLSPAPAFCADFDDPSSTSAVNGWSGITLGGGSALTLVTNPFVSQPRSLHATTSQLSGGSAYLERGVAMTTKLFVDFDVRFASLPADGVAISPFILTPPTYPGMDLYWFVDANNAYFQEYGDDYSPSQPEPSLDVWHHVAVALTTNGSTSTITTTVDGTASWSNHTLLHPWPMSTTATVRFGAPRIYAANNDLYIDNVVIRTQ